MRDLSSSPGERQKRQEKQRRRIGEEVTAGGDRESKKES